MSSAVLQPFPPTSEDAVRNRVLGELRQGGPPADICLESDCIRRIHGMSIRDYAHVEATAFWAEWNHPAEHARPLRDVMVSLMVYHWDALICPGSVCIDIGAHSGDTTIPMAILAGDHRRGVKGTVFAIEPNKDVRRVLAINLALNQHLAAFRLVPFAVTAETYGTVILADHGNANCNGGILDDSLGAGLSQRLRAMAEVTDRVDGLSLTALCGDVLTAAQRRDLCFIKIDCEGYDKRIIWSSLDLLRALQPVLFVEWFNLFGDAESHDLFAAAAAAGYTPYEPHSARPAAVDRRVGDLVLIPAGRRIGPFGAA